MSISYMNTVWECTDLKGSDLIAMLALANARNDKTGQCNPSIPTLAASVRVTERQIVRVLNGLEENGYLTISRGNGRGKSSHYEINIEKLRQKKGDIPVITNEEKVTPMSLFSKERVTSETEKGDIQGSERVTSSAQKGDISGNLSIYKNQYEPKEEPEREPAHASDEPDATQLLSPSESIPEPQPDPIDTTTLDLMKRWSKDKPKPVRVRMSQMQAALAAGEPSPAELPSVRPADPLPTTVQPGHVVSTPSGKVIIDDVTWLQMLSIVIDGLGYRELVNAGVARARSEAIGTLETLAKMPSFRTKDSIESLFASWSRARPDTPAPKPDWLIEHAGKLASGKIRYPNERKEVKRNVPDIRIAHADLTEYFANPANDFEITF